MRKAIVGLTAFGLGVSLAVVLGTSLTVHITG